MNPTDKPPFGRLITAMVTPFDDQSRLDSKATARVVEHLISSGTSSLVVAGTTGESPTLEDSERKELLREVLRSASGKAKTIMGVGTNSTAKTVKQAQEAEQAGADALLVVAPYYNKPRSIRDYSSLRRDIEGSQHSDFRLQHSITNGCEHHRSDFGRASAAICQRACGEREFRRRRPIR